MTSNYVFQYGTQCVPNCLGFMLVPKLQLQCPQLSIVGAGHARDEEAKAKHCSQNIAGMARSYGVIVLNCGQ